jgi:hypothetical protein
MVRRQQYLDKRNAERREYLKNNPEEQKKLYIQWGVTIVGAIITSAILVSGGGGIAFYVFIVTVVLAILFSPKYQE